MLSNIAKAFYYIFSLAPLVILSICPLIYPKLGHLTLIIVLLSILLVVAIYYGFIVFIKKSIAESTICVQSVEVNDESLLGTLLTYIIPLIGFFFSVPKLQLDIYLCCWTDVFDNNVLFENCDCFSFYCSSRLSLL